MLAHPVATMRPYRKRESPRCIIMCTTSFFILYILSLLVTPTTRVGVDVSARTSEDLPSHFTLMGTVEAKNGAKFEGALHVFMRVFSIQGHSTRFLVKGFIFFELAAREKYMELNPSRYAHSGGEQTIDSKDHMGHDYAFIHDPSTLDFKQLKVGLKDSAGTWSTIFSYHEDPGSPQSSHGSKEEFPSFQHIVDLRKENQYEIFVEGWDRRIEVDLHLEKAPMYSMAGPTAKKRLYQIVYPPYGPATNVTLTESIVVHSIQYHTRLGFHGMALYCRAHLCESFLAKPRIKSLVKEGKLVLIPWAVFPTYDNWGYFDQVVVNQHALLNFAGLDVLLLISDIDEFLAIPNSRKINELLRSNCIDAWNGCHNLERIEVYPESIQSDWTDLCSKPNPIGQLTHRMSQPSSNYGKLLVDPNIAIAMSIHYGTSCTEFSDDLSCIQVKECKDVPIECAWLGHYMNIIDRHRRAPSKSELLVDTSWMF